MTVCVSTRHKRMAAYLLAVTGRSWDEPCPTIHLSLVFGRWLSPSFMFHLLHQWKVSVNGPVKRTKSFSSFHSWHVYSVVLLLLNFRKFSITKRLWRIPLSNDQSSTQRKDSSVRHQRSIQKKIKENRNHGKEIHLFLVGRRTRGRSGSGNMAKMDYRTSVKVQKDTRSTTTHNIWRGRDML